MLVPNPVLGWQKYQKVAFSGPFPTHVHAKKDMVIQNMNTVLEHRHMLMRVLARAHTILWRTCVLIISHGWDTISNAQLLSI